MPEITIGGDGGNADAGVYIGTLQAVTGPRPITLQDGSQMEVLEWRFVLPSGEPVRGTTSLASGPRSKMFKWITALNNGRSPAMKSKLNTDELIGRQAVITVEIKGDGWPKIADVGPVPEALLQQQFVQATGLPSQQPAPQPAPQAPAPRPMTDASRAALASPQGPAPTPITAAPSLQQPAAADDLGF